MAKVTITNNSTSQLQLPTPLSGILAAKASKVFTGIPVHQLEASHDLQDARARGLFTIVVEEDTSVDDDMEESSVAEASGGTAALVAAHSALNTGVHGVGPSTVASAATVAAAVTAHDVNTGVHGVGGSTVASAADIGTAVGAHNLLGLSAAHGTLLCFPSVLGTGAPQVVAHGMAAPPNAQAFLTDLPAGPLVGPFNITMAPSDPVNINLTVTAGATVAILAWL